MSEKSTTWADVSQLVDTGELLLHHGSAQRCARHCADLVERLKAIQVRAGRLSRVEGLGTFPSGVALAAKFGRKASGGAYSMDQALADHIEVVQQMQQVFEKIEAMYGAADESAAQGIASAGDGF